MKKKYLSVLLISLLLGGCIGGGGGGSAASSQDNALKTCVRGDIPAAQNDDPLYGRQWHLKNTGQEGATAGYDINVEPVWQQGNEGQGVTVAVIDDGLQLDHEDLAANVLPGRSLNLVADNGYRADAPCPTSNNDDHGTAVGGLIAAAKNGLGGRGVAPQAKLIGSNVLLKQNDATEAQALLHGQDVVAVSNNSWGNNDDDNELGGIGPLAYAAIKQGATQARGGKGIVYLFAAGNGARNNTLQRSNYDAYNNHPYALNIAALGADGQPADYTEPGANVLVAAPSSSRKGLVQLFTTAIMGSYANKFYLDSLWPYINYRWDFGGTSGATPITAGVVALMLNANPALGWREVRWILAATARPVVNSTEVGPSSAFRSDGSYSHRTGYGLIDAAAAVALAKNFQPLPAMRTCEFDMGSAIAIPGNQSAVTRSVTFSGCSINQLESVDVTVDTDNTVPAGNLNISLRSPEGNSSQFATAHSCYDGDGAPYVCSKPYQNWTFHSVRHIKEAPAGNWTLTVRDDRTSSGISTGKLNSAKLTLRGF